MAGAASISGLASGLDTASIIDQLMSLEAVGQNRLKSRVSTEQLAVNALQTLNSKVASLAGKATELLKAGTWTAVSTTSTNKDVTVSAGTGAGPGSFSLRVDRTALSHRLELASPVSRTAAGTVPASVRLDRLDGTTPVDLTTDGTLQGLVDAINLPANETGLRATAVRVGEDQYRLLVESATTGTATDFTLTDAADGTDLLGGATVRAGRDAQVTLGDSIVATSTTNTFADLVPGVSITLGAAATGTSEISLVRDPSKITASVQGLVEAVNAALADIDSLTAYNPTTKATGLLNGDTAARELRARILATVFPADGTSLSDLGIQTDRSGKLVFDSSKLSAAVAADPTRVRERLAAPGTGFVSRLETVAKTASDKVTGTLTTAITGRTSTIRTLNDSIDQWDRRLELRRTALTRQFTALETALSQMNSQSNWLAGQINSLPSAGTGS